MDKTYKHIAFLVVPNATLLDITGPMKPSHLLRNVFNPMPTKIKPPINYILYQ